MATTTIGFTVAGWSRSQIFQLLKFNLQKICQPPENQINPHRFRPYSPLLRDRSEIAW